MTGKLRKRFGQTLVNHETIYKFVYESEIGKQWKLYEYLPRGKKKRTKRYGRKTQKGAVKNRGFIEMRQNYQAVTPRQRHPFLLKGCRGCLSELSLPTAGRKMLYMKKCRESWMPNSSFVTHIIHGKKERWKTEMA